MRSFAIYRSIARIFNYFADILFFFAETGKFSGKSWDPLLEPKISTNSELNGICINIANHLDPILKPKTLNKYDGQKYVENVTELVPSKYLSELKEFFNSPQMLQNASRYLGFNAEIKTFFLYANLPGVDSEQNEGSKAFHRDALCYRVYEIFFAVSSISDNNAPFFFVKNPLLQDRAEVIITNSMLEGDWSTSGRLSEADLSSSIKEPLDIGKFIGEPGSAIALNTGVTYHRGGFVKDGYRVVGRVVYGGEEYKNTKAIPFNRKIALRIHNLIEYKLGRFFRKID